MGEDKNASYTYGVEKREGKEDTNGSSIESERYRKREGRLRSAKEDQFICY